MASALQTSKNHQRDLNPRYVITWTIISIALTPTTLGSNPRGPSHPGNPHKGLLPPISSQESSPCTTLQDHTYRGTLLDCSYKNIQYFMPSWIPLSTITIMLNDNRLESFEADTFLNASGLRHLDISSNHFRQLHSSWFRGLQSSLKVFKASNNSISLRQDSINENIFQNLPFLRVLDLGMNSNQNTDGQYPEFLLDHLPFLEELTLDTFASDLDFGSIFDDVTTLKFLTLTGGARRIRNDTFKGFERIPLVTLRLENMELLKETEMDAFRPLVTLKNLYMYKVTQSLNTTLLSLKPFAERGGRQFDDIHFDSLGGDFRHMSTFQGTNVITKQYAQYLLNICLRNLSIISSNLFAVQFDTFMNTTLARCLKSFNGRNNPLYGEINAYFEFMSFAEIKSVTLTHNDLYPEPLPACCTTSGASGQTGCGLKVDSEYGGTSATPYHTPLPSAALPETHPNPNPSPNPNPNPNPSPNLNSNSNPNPQNMIYDEQRQGSRERGENSDRSNIFTTNNSKSASPAISTPQRQLPPREKIHASNKALLRTVNTTSLPNTTLICSELLRRNQTEAASNLIKSYTYSDVDDIPGVSRCFRLPPRLEYAFIVDMSGSMLHLDYVITIWPNSLKELYMSRDGIQDMSGQVLGLDRLELLDISYNDASKMNSYFFDYFPSLKTLLMREINFDPEFMAFSSSRLFAPLTNLETLDLTNNGLNLLSPDTFEPNNRLRVLILARNRFTSIPFEIEHTPELCLLNLSYSSISVLSETEMNRLDDQARRTDGSFSLVLDGNVMSCACSQIKFMRWLHTTPVNLDRAGNYPCIAEDGSLRNTSDFRGLDAFWRQCNGKSFLLISLVVLTLQCVGLTTGLLLHHFKTRLAGYLHQKILRRIRLKTPWDFPTGVCLEYADQEATWVCLTLRTFIEEELSLSTFIRHRDVLAHEHRDASISREIHHSWRVLLVITQSYLTSDLWSFYAMKVASSSASLTNQFKVVLLVEAGLEKKIPIWLLKATQEGNVITMDTDPLHLNDRMKSQLRKALCFDPCG